MRQSNKQTSLDETISHPETKGLFLLAFSVLLCLSLLSFNALDPSLNWLGLVGHYCAWGFNYLFGLNSFSFVIFSAWLGWRLLIIQKIEQLNLKLLYFYLLVISSSFLLNLVAEKIDFLPALLESKIYRESVTIDFPYPHLCIRYNLGGAPLYYLYRDLPLFNLQNLLSDVGIAITFSLSSLVFFLLLSGIRITDFLKSLYQASKQLGEVAKKVIAKIEKSRESVIGLRTVEKEPPEEIERRLINRPPLIRQARPPIREVKEHQEKSFKLDKRQAALKAQIVYNGDFTAYELPPLHLLNNAKNVDKPSLKKELGRLAERLEETLMSFGIEAKVGEINCGPTIASFEVHPAVGVKVQRIKALENDIALNLQAKSVRIIAPIPGKAAVGIEIPSRYPQEVVLKELLSVYKKQSRRLNIPILLGKTVSGEPVMADLAKMPHCLIAGATGAGKSVCINTIVLSILMNARPDEIKLLMIDPKKVELTAYSKLPHLIAPVITEAHGAYAALNWVVKEMQMRYEILKQLGLRNITAFNHRKINQEFEDSLNLDIPKRMYYIVMIIDEFADLMLSSTTDIETPIARIAQMARAVGIHLILATQRPSREVITGLIKANFPTRIAFKVASRINSQIILDENGAEALLGNGDMLFLPPGTSHISRAQGAYVSDEEINRIIAFICNQAPPKYLIKSFDTLSQDNSLFNTPEAEKNNDELIDRALQVIVQNKNASTTFLQRKLKIGYARAAGLMDELEARGVIGPQEGSKPRKILYDGISGKGLDD